VSEPCVNCGGPRLAPWTCVLCSKLASTLRCAPCSRTYAAPWWRIGVGAACIQCLVYCRASHVHVSAPSIVEGHFPPGVLAALQRFDATGKILVTVRPHVVHAIAYVSLPPDFERDVVLSGMGFERVCAAGSVCVFSHATRDPEDVQTEWVRRGRALGE